jgi:hypothetical protein
MPRQIVQSLRRFKNVLIVVKKVTEKTNVKSLKNQSNASTALNWDILLQIAKSQRDQESAGTASS